MKTVLLVEDDPLNRKLFTDLLSSRGVRVVPVMDGESAMTLVGEGDISLVVMDVALASEMTGIEVVRWMKARPDLAAIPVIVVTAYAMVHQTAEIEASGCDALMTKPIQTHAFLSLVDRFLKTEPRSVSQ